MSERKNLEEEKDTDDEKKKKIKIRKGRRVSPHNESVKWKKSRACSCFHENVI